LAVRQIAVLWLATGAITLVAVVIAAGTDNKALSATATAIFAVASVACGWQLNAETFKITSEKENIRAAQNNAAMLAGAFGWGGATILGGYYLTDLFWHHAWQYGGAMVLFSAGLISYILLLRNSASRLRSKRMLKAAAALATVQACAAAAGLAFLLWSGKLGTNKHDWLANHVFLSGGITIVVLSALSARAQFLRPK